MGIFDGFLGRFQEEEYEEYEEDKTTPSSSKSEIDILSKNFSKNQLYKDSESLDFSFFIVHATSCDVFYDVAKKIKDGNCIALSIKDMDPLEAQRLTDCICGVIYSLEGHIEIEATKPDVLILTPKNIEITTGNYASILSKLASF